MISTSTYQVNNNVIVLLTSDDLNSCFFSNTTHIKYLHVNSLTKIFPSLFTHQPGTIIIDHDYVKGEVQDIVRRIRTNPFYNKLKICCLKSSANTKADDQLRIIGVDYLIYRATNR
jgi:hypothetical protein